MSLADPSCLIWSAMLGAGPAASIGPSSLTVRRRLVRSDRGSIFRSASIQRVLHVRTFSYSSQSRSPSSPRLIVALRLLQPYLYRPEVWLPVFMQHLKAKASVRFPNQFDAEGPVCLNQWPNTNNEPDSRPWTVVPGPHPQPACHQTRRQGARPMRRRSTRGSRAQPQARPDHCEFRSSWSVCRSIDQSI